MRLKTKIIIIIFISNFLVSFTPLFCSQQDSGREEKKKIPPVEVLTTMHPFYDAKELDEAFKERKWKAIEKILSKYADEEITGADKAQEAFEGNPFLMPYINAWAADVQKLLEEGTESGITVTDVKIEETKALTSTAKGFLSPAVVVDALATLIADRFKEELSIAYLKKLREKLEKSDLNLLFPTAKNFLLSSEIFNFKLFLPNLKAAFQKDLHNWDSNLYKFLKNKVNDNEIAESNELYLAMFFLNLVKRIRAGEHLADIVDKSNIFEYINGLDHNFSNPIRLLSLVSRNLRDKEGKGWIKPKDFKILIEDGGKDVRNLFIGLIYAKELEEMGKIEFKVKIKNGNREDTVCRNKKLSQIIFDNKDKIKKMNDHLHSIILLAEKIENQITKIKDAEEKGENVYGKYRFYLGAVVDFVELGSDVTKMFGDEDIGGKIDDFIKKARNILVIADNVHEKQYSMAFVNTLELLKEILDDNSPTKKLIMKYMTFAVNIVTAQDAKELRKVLEAAALPVKSYLIKRVNDFNISLNAYPGIFGGGDILTTGKDLNGTKEGLNFGFAAPIGVAFSWKDKIKTNNNLETSTSLFISIIDIGAVVNWRLSGVDKGLPEFHWKNVLAPGLFLISGLKGTPISVGAGIQYGPQLRKIELVENDPNAVIETSSLRFGVIIAVDIPIFNIYTKEDE